MTKPLATPQEIATALEECRIDMLIDVGLCCKEEYTDYLGRIINQQFKELAEALGLPKHASDTAEKFAAVYRLWNDNDANPSAPTLDKNPTPKNS